MVAGDKEGLPIKAWQLDCQPTSQQQQWKPENGGVMLSRCWEKLELYSLWKYSPETSMKKVIFRQIYILSEFAT